MDPELGMGIQFMRGTLEQRRRFQELIRRVNLSPDTVAEALVEPEELEWESDNQGSAKQNKADAGEEGESDPLVELFGTAATMSREEFLRALEQYRPPAAAVSEAELNSPAAQRREPRIEVSRPVQVRLTDGSEESVKRISSMINISHHGARIDNTALGLKPGDPVHLVSDGLDARFRVIWVGAPGTPQENQVGLQKVDE
jgi:hypothetical protein